MARKPGAWSNSPIRAQFADPLKDWIDTADTADRRQFFTALDEASQAAGFLTALDAAEQLVVDGADPSNPSLGMLVRRISQGSQFESGIVDLEVYDRLFTVPGQQQSTVEGSPAA